MKRLVIAATILLSTTCSFAQTKNDVLLSGAIMGSASKDANGTRRNNIYINPAVGYFITNNWTVGVFGGYSTRSSIDTSFGSKKTTNSEFAVGPFIRYTSKVNNIFFIFQDLDLGYSSGRASLAGTVVANSGYRTFFAAYTPQVGINIKNGFALNFGIGGLRFEDSKLKSDANSSTRFSYDFGRRVQIGVSKFFSKRKKVIVEEQ